MNPRLIAISGSLKGTIFDLTEHENLIGREASNQICLNDLSVSRRHCLIKRETAIHTNASAGALQERVAANELDEFEAEASQFTIIDLESFNGTFVNGVPVKEHPLAH